MVFKMSTKLGKIILIFKFLINKVKIGENIQTQRSDKGIY